MFRLLFIFLYIWVGGLDWFFDIIDCVNIIQLSLEDKNDIILNGLFKELFEILPLNEYKIYLNNLEQIYHINLDDVNDMTLDIQEKIIKNLNKTINELKK